MRSTQNAMERPMPQPPAADPVAERERFFLELAIAELTATVPQSAPAVSR